MHSHLPSHFPRDRRHIDNLTSRLLQKYWYDGLAAIEYSFEVHSQNAVPIRFRDLQEAGLATCPSIVHENIHPSKALENGLEHVVDLWLHGNIRLDLYCCPAHPFDFAYNPVSGINAAGVVYRYFGTLSRQHNRNGLADASASPSDDSYLFIKIHDNPPI